MTWGRLERQHITLQFLFRLAGPVFSVRCKMRDIDELQPVRNVVEGQR